MMTFTPAALGLIAVLVIGYLAAISIGTWAYFSNEKDY